MKWRLLSSGQSVNRFFSYLEKEIRKWQMIRGKLLRQPYLQNSSSHRRKCYRVCVHARHSGHEKRSRAENQRLYGKCRMKKRTEKRRTPAGIAPAGGKIYLPAISAPNSRLGRVWVKRKSYKIIHRKKFGICRKIRLKSEDFSRIWSECRDSNPRPLGPEPSAIPNFATPRQLEYYRGFAAVCQEFCMKFSRAHIVP